MVPGVVVGYTQIGDAAARITGTAWCGHDGAPAAETHTLGRIGPRVLKRTSRTSLSRLVRFGPSLHELSSLNEVLVARWLTPQLRLSAFPPWALQFVPLGLVPPIRL